MDRETAIDSLKKEAAGNPVASAVFHMFAARERARQTVTVGALDQRMKSEGFEFDREEYVKILKLLANMGLGKIEVNSKGRVTALKDVKMTLQSIGMAAIGEKMNLAALKQRNRFSQLEGRAESLAETANVIKPRDGSAGAGFPVSITVVVNGKPVNLRVPKEFNQKDIADLVVKLTHDDNEERRGKA